jgi:hypothetical protein
MARRLLWAIDSGFTAVNQRIDGVDAELGRVKDALMEHGRQLKDIRAATVSAPTTGMTMSIATKRTARYSPG